MNKKLVMLFMAITFGFSVMYAQTTSPATSPSTNRTSVGRTNATGTMNTNTTNPATTNRGPATTGLRSTGSTTNQPAATATTTNRAASTTTTATNRPASTATTGTNRPASTSTNTAPSTRPETTTTTSDTRPAVGTTNTTATSTQTGPRRSETNQPPASHESQKEMTGLYTVSIPFEKRTYWKIALERIIDDETLLDVSTELNDNESVKKDDQVLMLVPLQKDKDGTLLYEYTIKKNDIIADISYLFYEDYKWKTFFDYNTIPKITPKNGGDAYYLIEIDDTLLIPIDEENVIGYEMYDLKVDINEPLKTETLPITTSTTKITEELVSIDSKPATTVTATVEKTIPQIESPSSRLMELLNETVETIKSEVTLYAQVMANDYYIVEIPMENRSDEVAEVISEFLEEKSMEYQLAVLINDSEELVDVLDAMYVPMELVQKEGKYFYKYTVKKNDTVSKIAGWFYNDVLDWDGILDNNDIKKVRGDYYLITPGDELLIPISTESMIAEPTPVKMPSTQPSVTTNTKPASATNNGSKPSTSTNKGTRPTGASDAVSTKPSSNTAPVTASTNKSATTTTTPATSTTNKPPASASTNKPATTTASPTSSTNKPPTTTTTPSTSSTNKPATTTTAPSTSTNKPAATITAPTTSTNQPAGSSTAPATTSTNRAPSSSAPSTSSSTNRAPSGQPSTTTTSGTTSDEMTTTEPGSRPQPSE